MGFLFRLPISFYVSPTGSDGNPGTRTLPFATIGAARTAVQAVTAGQTDHVYVYLRDGVHAVSSTQAFTQADSGQNGFSVIWTNMRGETPRVSGGSLITGWSDQGGGIWRASTSLNFRQLYVNGVRAVRARLPNSGSFYDLASWDETNDRCTAQTGTVASWAQLTRVEMVILGKGVNQTNGRIASRSGDVVTFQEPERTKLFSEQTYPPRDDVPTDNVYFFENALEFVTAEGEFYLDTVNDHLYYMKRSTDNMATAEVYAPQVESLLSITGSGYGTPAHHIRFYGIHFEHSTWLYPETDGYVGDQSQIVFEDALPEDEITSYPGTRLPGAVTVSKADHLRFERCVFKHLGASGLNFYEAVDDSDVVGNVFWDISGGGMSIDLLLEGNPAETRKICQRNTVTNNYIKKTGQDYYQTTGIHVGYGDTINIEHNEVTDVPYTGITTGWGWEDTANAANDITVQKNRVWDFCKLMSDGGGIYTLSEQSGGLIDRNYVFGSTRTSVQGQFSINCLYCDIGSDNITLSNNVLELDGLDGPDDLEIFLHLNGPNITDTNNAGSSQTTKDEAGLEAGYVDIRALAA